MEILIKICSKCKRELPADLTFFANSSTGKYGLSSWCRKCHKEYSKKWREENPEKRRNHQKSYHERNSNKRYILNRLHLRIKNLKFNQKYCSICNQKKKLELSNIDGKYSENPKDYWWLCHECHHLYDRTNKTHIKLQMRGKL